MCTGKEGRPFLPKVKQMQKAIIETKLKLKKSQEIPDFKKGLFLHLFSYARNEIFLIFRSNTKLVTLLAVEVFHEITEDATCPS